MNKSIVVLPSLLAALHALAAPLAVSAAEAAETASAGHAATDLPQPILPGGLVVPLYPPGSPLINAARVREPEYFNRSKAVPGRITWITNIHNPSIEVHAV